jgi:hypothetical protein
VDHHLRGLAIVFEVLETFVVGLNFDSARTILFLEVVVPQVGRLENVAVRVDHQLTIGHDRFLKVVTLTDILTDHAAAGFG